MQRDDVASNVTGFIAGPGESGGRVVVSTHDRGEATRVLRHAYPQLAVELGPSAVPFVFRQSAVGDGRLSSTELMLAGPARASGTFHDGRLVVGEVLAGGLTAEYARARIDPAQPFLQPTGVARMRLDDLHLRMTVLDADAFRRAAERYEQNGARRRLLPHRAVLDRRPVPWGGPRSHIQRSVRDPQRPCRTRSSPASCSTSRSGPCSPASRSPRRRRAGRTSPPRRARCGARSRTWRSTRSRRCRCPTSRRPHGSRSGPSRRCSDAISGSARSSTCTPSGWRRRTGSPGRVRRRRGDGARRGRAMGLRQQRPVRPALPGPVRRAAERDPPRAALNPDRRESERATAPG